MRRSALRRVLPPVHAMALGDERIEVAPLSSSIAITSDTAQKDIHRDVAANAPARSPTPLFIKSAAVRVMRVVCNAAAPTSLTSTFSSTRVAIHGLCLCTAVRWQTASSTSTATKKVVPLQSTSTTPSAEVAATTPSQAPDSASTAKTEAKDKSNAAAKEASSHDARDTTSADTADATTDAAVFDIVSPVSATKKKRKPARWRTPRARAAAYQAKFQSQATSSAPEGEPAAEEHPWRDTTAAAAATVVRAGMEDGIAFTASTAELFSLDEAKHDADSAVAAKEPEEEEKETSPELREKPTSHAGKETAAAAPADAVSTDIEDTLLEDPFHVPSVDDDAFARDGGASGGSGSSPSAAPLASATRLGGGAALTSKADESVLSAVDLLCDDLYHCQTDVLFSFAKTRGARRTSKSEVVLQLVERANREAHGENTDLSATRSLLGDVFDDSVRTSGLRTAWTNKSLEASHIEMACERFLSYERMVNTNKTLMMRHNTSEAARVMRKLTRIFQEEQEQLSLVAVGGVFRTYRAEADEIIRSLSVTELLSPFSALLVSYVRYGSSATALTRENVNDRLVQLELFQPTVQEMDDTTILHRLMDMLDPAVQEVEMQEAELLLGHRRSLTFDSANCIAITARVFSETSHAKWNTNAAPEWVHDLARLFCNWETIVRTDLPRFEDVPRYVFDCILSGVVNVYLLQRIYGDLVHPRDVPLWTRSSVRKALERHFNNEERIVAALADLTAYVHAITASPREGVRGEFFIAVLSQMQGAFQGLHEERSAMHDERVAVILKAVCKTASECTRSHGLFPLLVRITCDLRFHLRFQRVYKNLSTADRKLIRTNPSIRLAKTLEYFEGEYHLTPLSIKAVGFLVVQLLYLALRGDGSKRPVLERLASVTGVPSLDVVGLTELKAVDAHSLRIAFPPQLSYNSWLNESDTREKSVYNVLPSVAVKGSTNQAMIVSQAPMMKALDAISRVPWRINKYMLHVQEAIVREGFGFGKIRPGFYPLHYYTLNDGSIRYPSDRRRAEADDAHVSGIGKGRKSRRIAGSGLDEDDGSVFNISLRRRSQAQISTDWKELSEVRSSRIHYLQALRQARSILQFSHIYFPNSMDFRGRMYPLPGRLNHTGSDPFRGLLEYAEPKPLGSVGLYWLKVHLANKMGMSKLSFDERVHYVDEHLDDVMQSAESPLQGDRWWQEASEPLQCLMACKEVANAMKCSQGPEKFLSRLPVAVDGSYNGLQHYSAIGRDAFGAKLVNLVPSDRPADAYTGILKEMLKSIHEDAARDHQVAQRCLGSGKGQDRDHIKRKTIKRPIMTQVYGVTAFGMSEQIFDELQKQNKSHGLWTHTDMKEMSMYLRDKVLESLGVTFRETQNCRKWINDVTRLIWKVQPPELRNALCWTTPLGLVVRQPYKVRSESSMFTTGGYTRINGDSVAPASRKQLTAIAPNLIHSLDATHLAMTALEMQHQGLSMMAVHDSYWTYACDLPKLSQILREQFVNLYSKYDPLWELKEQWEETYFMDLRRHGVKLPEPPKRGDLDLNSVLHSPYFFS